MPINKTGVKKNGLQQYRVRVNYTDAAGKAHQIERTAYGLSEANALEQSLIAEYKNKQRTPTAKITVKQLIDEYDVYHSHETRKTSHDNIMRNLRNRVQKPLGDYRLDRLTQPVLAGWKNDIAASGLSIRTKQNAYATFAALLNYAVKMEYILKNPLTSLGNFKDAETVDKPAEKLHYYTADQFQRYIAVAKEKAASVTDWGYYVFFCIAFYTGARKGEINALKWSDIDGNIMHIRRSIAQKLKGGDVEGPPKNKSSYRDLQIHDPLLAVLGEHKRRQQEASRLFSDDYRVCGGERPLRDTSIENKNKSFSETAGLPHIRIHDFRHTHASLLVNEGINIQEIARRLGHSDVQMTWNTYSHLYPREEERAVEILNKIQP
ncbi:MAG: site-specific integrase [Oscillospiraceae bacterium]